MAKKITKNTLKKIITESVKRILNENTEVNYNEMSQTLMAASEALTKIQSNIIENMVSQIKMTYDEDDETGEKHTFAEYLESIAEKIEDLSSELEEYADWAKSFDPEEIKSRYDDYLKYNGWN